MKKKNNPNNLLRYVFLLAVVTLSFISLPFFVYAENSSIVTTKKVDDVVNQVEEKENVVEPTNKLDDVKEGKSFLQKVGEFFKDLFLKVKKIFLGGKSVGDTSKVQEKERQDGLIPSMKTKLPETPLPEIKYPIQGYRIPGLGGFCWLESSSGLIKYLEPDVDFDTFIFYAKPTLVMAGRNKNERWGPGLNQTHAFVELGYTAFRGSTNPSRPPQSLFPDIDPRNLIYFKTAEEELDLMKKLVSAQIIPTIIYQGDFSTVIGYDKNGLWIVKSDPSQTDKAGRNFMTYPVSFEPTFITYKELFDNWGIDYQFFWFEKTGQRKPMSEIYAENKKNAREAARNMRVVIDYLKNGGNDFTYEIDIPSSMTLYRYFTKQGNIDLANKYLEIAKIYESQRISLGLDAGRSQSETRKFSIETLTKVQPLLEKAAAMWP